MRSFVGVALLLAASLLAVVNGATQGASCFGSPATITGSGTIDGTDGDDVIQGSDGADVILAKFGNDKVCAAGGNDRAGGGPGNDQVGGGAGDDQLDAGLGDDTVLGDEGDDVIRCGPGNDAADGGPGTDVAAASGFEACETITSADAVDDPVPTHRVEATLTRRQEVPRPQGARRARGRFTGTVRRTSEGGGELTWRLTFRRLTGRALAAHIHRGRRGKAGPVVIPLCAPCRSPKRGKTEVEDPKLVMAILRGRTYVNVHTRRNPKGEIRGQITRVEE